MDRILKYRFVRFLLVGALNTFVGYGLFAIFIFLNFHYALAVTFATILGVLFNFKSIGKLVFKSHDNSLIYRFVSVYIFTYTLNIILLAIFNYYGYHNMYINGFILIFPLAIISFILNKKYVFKEVQ